MVLYTTLKAKYSLDIHFILNLINVLVHPIHKLLIRITVKYNFLNNYV